MLLLGLLVLGGIRNAVQRHSARSESYSWGAQTADSAATLVGTGMDPEQACKTAINFLHSTPPPAGMVQGEAQRGCLDALKKR